MPGSRLGGGGRGWQLRKTNCCDHMTCRACGNDIRWECLANDRTSRRDGNHRHATNCTYNAAEFGGDEGD
jgi:hypothetical protein